MEQAHTQLIAQLNERISAADNTPLYMKFAQTVKNAVRSGILEHGNILPGERDLSQLTGVSRITVRKAMQALEEEGSGTPAVTERKSTISSSIRSKKRAVFSAGGVAR
jgi:DNA-binding transcriptional regulator YhcF (GntR family)